MTFNIPALQSPIPSAPLPPLHHAANEGDTNRLASLLADGADVNAPAENNATALYWASVAGHADAARVLLDAGADPNLATDRGATPLLVSVRGGHAPVVRMLLARGAGTEIRVVRAPDPPPTPEQQAEGDKLLRHTEELCKSVDVSLRRQMERRLGKERADAFFAEQEKERAESDARLARFLSEPQRQNLIMIAIRIGSADTLQALLDGGVAPVADRDGVGDMTPLNFALGIGQAGMASRLIAAGADPNEDNPLFVLAARRDYDRVRQLLEAGADPNRAAKNTESGMFIALMQGDTRMLDLLMDWGGRVDAGGEERLSALMHNAPDTVRVLVRRRMGTDWIDLIERGDRDEVQNRLDRQPDLSAVREDGETGLNLAARRGDRDLMQLLIARGANPNQPAQSGLTPLHTVVRHNDSALVRLLMDAGADVNATTNGGHTALYLALIQNAGDAANALRAAGATETLAEFALAGNGAQVRSQIEQGASPDEPNRAGVTALMGAAAAGDLELMRYLHERGASPNARDQDGHTAVYHALVRDRDAAFHLLLDWGADAQTRDRLGHTLLFTAVMAQKYDLARRLIEVGVPIGDEGDALREHLLHTLLLLDATDPSFARLRFLLQNGGDPNATGADGATLLVAALERQAWQGLLDMLLESGADINRADDNGMTPLRAAVDQGNAAQVRYLLDHGADPNLRARNASALGIAGAMKSAEIAALLRNAGAQEPQDDEDIPSYLRELPDGWNLDAGATPAEQLDQVASIRFALPDDATSGTESEEGQS